MKKLMLIGLLIGLILINFGIVSAEDPIAPDNLCEVSGTIDNLTRIPAGYKFNFSISQVKEIPGNYSNSVPCEPHYTLGSHDIYLYDIDIINGDNFSIGQEIVFIMPPNAPVINYSFVDKVVNEECKTYFWFDDTNKSCGQKEFCGTYMYSGLRTFNTQQACEVALNYATCADEGELCAGIAGIACCSGLSCTGVEDYPDAAGTCLNYSACIDECGDGKCNEGVHDVLCEIGGCSCAETKSNCPADCGKQNKVGIYSILLFIVAVVLIFVAYKLTKWFLWVLAVVAILAAFYLIFIY
jgi:hypothetical protein